MRKPTTAMIDLLISLFGGEEGATPADLRDAYGVRATTVKGLLDRELVDLRDAKLYLSDAGEAWLVATRRAVVVNGSRICGNAEPMTQDAYDREVRRAELDAAPELNAIQADAVLVAHGVSAALLDLLALGAWTIAAHGAALRVFAVGATGYAVQVRDANGVRFASAPETARRCESASTRNATSADAYTTCGGLLDSRGQCPEAGSHVGW